MQFVSAEAFSVEVYMESMWPVCMQTPGAGLWMFSTAKLWAKWKFLFIDLRLPVAFLNAGELMRNLTSYTIYQYLLDAEVSTEVHFKRNEQRIDHYYFTTSLLPGEYTHTHTHTHAHTSPLPFYFCFFYYSYYMSTVTWQSSLQLLGAQRQLL